MKITAKVSGIEQCMANAMCYLNQQKMMATGSLKDGAYLVKEWANDHITPVDAGIMVNTSYVWAFDAGGDTIAAQVVYTAPYSIYVEDPDSTLNHRHGLAFNLAYADKIAEYREHARKPAEQDHFLEKTVSLKKNEVFSLVKNGAMQVNVSA